jgi:hypothetical protein
LRYTYVRADGGAAWGCDGGTLLGERQRVSVGGTVAGLLCGDAARSGVARLLGEGGGGASWGRGGGGAAGSSMADSGAAGLPWGAVAEDGVA